MAPARLDKCLCDAFAFFAAGQGDLTAREGCLLWLAENTPGVGLADFFYLLEEGPGRLAPEARRA